MMKKNTLFIVLFYVVTLANAQTIDVSAVDLYYTMTEEARQGKPIPEKVWAGFLAHKGVAQYVENQGFDTSFINRYKRTIEFVYNPQNDSLLQRRLKDPQTYWTTYLVHYYKKNEAIYKSYIQKIVNDKQAYLDTLYKNTYSALPQRMHRKASDATLYFIPIHNDAIANGKFDIVFSVFCAYECDKTRYGVLGGHEIHHILRKNKSISSPKDKYLYDGISEILNEGLPDLIDKQALSQSELDYFSILMPEGEKSLPAVDSMIMNHAKNIKWVSSKADARSVIQMSGHIPGCYMAHVIARNGFKQDLIDNADDPVRFFELYNKAALMDKDKPYVFSKTTMKYLKKLKQK